jgi:hypothetical protein
MPFEYDTLQIWGLKRYNRRFWVYFSSQKKWADKIAGIFSVFRSTLKTVILKTFMF